MLVLAVLGFLGIFFAVVVAKECKGQSDVAFGINVAIPIQLCCLIFGVICLLAPTKYGENKLELEYKLTSFTVENSQECYVSLDNGLYTFYSDNNKPTTIDTDSVTAVIYISEAETPKICRYVQKPEWTWYAAPTGSYRVTYILYIPEGSIAY